MKDIIYKNINNKITKKLIKMITLHIELTILIYF